jgi:hypothetical protein
MREDCRFALSFVLLAGVFCQACGSPEPVPLTATVPNVSLQVNITGPYVGRGSGTGDALLEVMYPHAVLLAPAKADPANLVTWQAERYHDRYGNVRKGDYLAALAYWATPPYLDPEGYGTVAEIVPNGPQERFTILGNEQDKVVELDYNPTGTGPHHPVGGTLRISGNPPLHGDELQLVFYPAQKLPGATPAAGYVIPTGIGENNDGQRDFETLLNAGTYGLSCLGPALRNSHANRREPIPLEVSGPIEGFTLHMRNNWGPPPANTGSISGEVVVPADWDLASGWVRVEAQRQSIGPDPPGALGPIGVDGFHGLYDEAHWHIPVAELENGRAGFLLGWLNDGEFTLTVSCGPHNYRHMPQVAIGPGNRVVIGVELAPPLDD